MNADDQRLPELDARLRRMLGGLDAAPGFEARVMQRAAAQAARSGALRADLRAQFERRRERTRRRLRQEAWSNAGTIAGIGLAAGALVWRYSAQIGHWAAAVQLPGTLDLVWVAGITLAGLATGLWPILRRMPGLMK